MSAAVQVSIIATVYNEGESIRQLLDSLVAQTRQPDEVVICDGGSNDNTVAIIHEYADRLPNLHVLIAPGANISRGRNLAIKAARGPIIAATDAGVHHVIEWLARLMAPWEENLANPPRAVAGFFLPDYDSVFEIAIAATVLPLTEDIDPAKFLPSSRFGCLYQNSVGRGRWLSRNGWIIVKICSLTLPLMRRNPTSPRPLRGHRMR